MTVNNLYTTIQNDMQTHAFILSGAGDTFPLQPDILMSETTILMSGTPFQPILNILHLHSRPHLTALVIFFEYLILRNTFL
jgi:hypothetical protein